MANIDTKDATRGLYEKFTVTRNDGRSAPGEKHERCEYFVLDLDHDPHALAALTAYRDSLRASGEHRRLATDLTTQIAAINLRAFGAPRD